MKAPNRASEMIHYEEQFRRMENNPILKSAVTWDEYSISLSSWYRKIGFVLSPSDFESFHYSIADGVASGATPVVWPWDGAKEIYTDDWVVANTDEAYDKIQSSLTNSVSALENREIINNKYGLDAVFLQLENTMW